MQASSVCVSIFHFFIKFWPAKTGTLQPGVELSGAFPSPFFPLSFLAGIEYISCQGVTLFSVGRGVWGGRKESHWASPS